VLIGTTDMLEESAPAELQPQVSLMKDALVSARSVVRGLLTFGRRTPLEKTHVNPIELVDKVLALTAGELRVADVKVEKDFDPELPSVWADANQLQQVLVNLITNAKHAMENLVGERRLGVSLRRNGPDHIRVRVEDSGPGIPADLITKVFDPFVTTKSEGTGLGLSISYGIISEHGGRIRVESPEGRGAVFTIDLPIETSQAEPASNLA
jgi:signal transduction histidine kinase